MLLDDPDPLDLSRGCDAGRASIPEDTPALMGARVTALAKPDGGVKADWELFLGCRWPALVRNLLWSSLHACLPSFRCPQEFERIVWGTCIVPFQTPIMNDRL